MSLIYQLSFIVHKPKEVEIYTKKKDVAGLSVLNIALFKLRYQHFQFRFPYMPNNN